MLAALGVIMIFGAGCGAYDVPEYKEITPSQSAFMVPMSGQTSNQKQFMSEKFLETAKVATKRVQIPHEKIVTGRTWVDYKFVPSMRLIVVERRPETREWTNSNTTGTSASNQGLAAESKESIGFTVGMCCSSQIDEADAARFLYRYNNKSLSEIMDFEVRARVEGKFVEECSKYYLKDEGPNGLLQNKQKIMEAVRRDVLPYFKDRGITITVLAMKGELSYNNADVQKAIDDRFISEQRKQKAVADAFVAKTQGAIGLEYQIKLMDAITRKTQAETNKLIAQGMYDGKITMPTTLVGQIAGFNLNTGK